MVGRSTSSIPCCYFLGFGLVHADTVAASDVVVLRRAQANAPAASFWLRHVLDDGGRGDYTSLSWKECRGRNLQGTVAFYVNNTVIIWFKTEKLESTVRENAGGNDTVSILQCLQDTYKDTLQTISTIWRIFNDTFPRYCSLE